MDDIERVIKERHSVRSYLDREIESDKVKVLNELIDSINKENDLNIQLILNDNEVFDKFSGFILHYGKLKNCKNYLAMIGKTSDSLDEKIGFNGEKIVLKAQSLGLNTCWVAGTYKKKLVRAKINDGEELVCVIAIGYGETQGKTRKSKTIDDVTKSNDYPDWFKKGVEYALLAPTAINQQKFIFEYLGDNNVRATKGIGPKTKIDLGIVKYHFSLGANRKINWK